MRDLYLTNRFFALFGGVILLFALAFPFGWLFPVAIIALVVSITLSLVDYFILFNKHTHVDLTRIVPKIFSLHDENNVELLVRNAAARPLQVSLIDELPIQLQRRDFQIDVSLLPDQEVRLAYSLRPLSRGEYHFGSLIAYLSTQIGLLQRRQKNEQPTMVPVYPSVLQMKRMELRAFDRRINERGIKKMRRIGHSYEFEQIKEYVRGDDYRSINWKATGRSGKIMVNQYEDERAQSVYSIIDKSRNMRMPFEGLSLMDYAINTSLVISNIALQKHDKAGLISFSDLIGTTIKADRKANQLNKILTALYNERERAYEANYELLYLAARKLINGRSLLMLYTNFESMFALDRVLPLLRRINNIHLLVVIFFENTEIEKMAHEPADDLEGIYTQTVAQQFLSEKTAMVQKLRQFGIQAVLTRPEDLSVSTVNKYLELKSRGLI